MERIRLDRDGNAPVPEGYILISTEVEFLKLATTESPLQIRSDRLCTWAETFFGARGIPFQESVSYTRDLKGLLPSLNPAEISRLVELLGAKLDTLERPLQIDILLDAVAPDALWHGPPSLDHFARWLLWLDEADTVDVITPLLNGHISRWQTENLPFDSQLYTIRTKEAAQETLISWLGITDREQFPIKQEYPLEVPVRYQDTARQIWGEEIIKTRGARFITIIHQKIPFSLKKIAADETYQYYLHNPDELDIEVLHSILPYLNARQSSVLRKILPPRQPSHLPADPISIVTWYIQEYLPYREWQGSSDSEEAKVVGLRAARQFEMWYLENYPRGINGSNLHHWLSFNKIHKINCPENCITLLIILDGMHVPDSRLLLQSVLAQTQRLLVTSYEYVFAPIPTVTRFAKEALLKGVPPDRAGTYEPMGKVLPENQSPAVRLRDAEKGKIYIWRVLEPDNTYHHKNTSENLTLEIEGRLKAEAVKIKEIVDSIPDGIVLQIILTTDHGRLLSETRKTIQVPANMESHGRAAWGQSVHPFENGQFFIEDDVAYLLGESYGMLNDIALPLDEGAFKDNSNRTGSELFPHGGIFPEEVILPWIVLVRDLVQPEAKIIITGNGTARREGAFNINAINKSDLDLVLENVILTLRTGSTIALNLDMPFSPRSPTPRDFPYSPWPSASDVEAVRAVARVRLPNQMVYEYPVDVTLDSGDFYIRPKDNILEDLD